MNIDDLVRGSIDMHCHSAPDALFPARMDALDTAKWARQMGMRAIVLKSTFYNTGPIAMLVSQLVPEVKVFGGICLEYQIGGLNFYAIEASARCGARVVWMPTHSSSNSRPKTRSRLPGVTLLEGDGFSILNRDHALVPEMGRILSLVKEHNLILASGHISPPETFALVEEAKSVGISKIVITHASSTQNMEAGPNSFTLEYQRRLGQMGAFIEHSYVCFMPTDFREDPKPMVEAIRYVGAEHCIMSTDLGQYYNPPPAEGMRMFIALLLKNGISEREIELMAKTNPAKLLDLD
jgi:Family of unknown function (DUF6282)